ncbi:hypothetical protein C8J57DRAFT_1469312 [Mycena rebaudengoi]|nr:hypothetical protein C8J57DRAFT_1469312 [Mycena rebaudengoi]
MALRGDGARSDSGIRVAGAGAVCGVPKEEHTAGKLRGGQRDKRAEVHIPRARTRRGGGTMGPDAVTEADAVHDDGGRCSTRTTLRSERIAEEHIPRARTQHAGGASEIRLAGSASGIGLAGAGAYGRQARSRVVVVRLGTAKALRAASDSGIRLGVRGQRGVGRKKHGGGRAMNIRQDTAKARRQRQWGRTRARGVREVRAGYIRVRARTQRRFHSAGTSAWRCDAPPPQTPHIEIQGQRSYWDRAARPVAFIRIQGRRCAVTEAQRADAEGERRGEAKESWSGDADSQKFETGGKQGIGQNQQSPIAGASSLKPVVQCGWHWLRQGRKAHDRLQTICMHDGGPGVILPASIQVLNTRNKAGRRRKFGLYGGVLRTTCIVAAQTIRTQAGLICPTFIQTWVVGVRQEDARQFLPELADIQPTQRVSSTFH